MEYRKLSTTVEGGVGYLLLDSGHRFNMLSLATLREMRNASAALLADCAVKVLVISGYPGESFAVGADIAQMRDFTPLQGLELGEAAQALFEFLEDADKPVIGALNGITMGGGCDLSLACDLRLASENLRFAHPGARLGILTGFCGTQKLPRLVGRSRALEIFMTAATYGARDALRIGYVNRVYPAAAFWPEVRAFAESLAARPASLLATVKLLANRGEDLDLKSGCALERSCYRALFAANP